MNRSLVRTLPLAAVGTAVLLLGPATGTAAAAKHAPCPTTGTTLVKATGPNVRVWREGATLKACTRKAGQRRYLRTLGSWSTATKVAVGGTSVAWTTPTGTAEAPTDRLATRDVRTGRTWLSTVRAVPAASASTPAADDVVLRLLTDGRVTTWVTGRGVVAAAVRTYDDEATTMYGEGHPGTVPFHVGRRFVLGDAGPAQAASVASRLELSVGGDGDECGGTDDYRVTVPAFGDRQQLWFVYASESYERPDCG
ncbi:hypothetical protein [Patulibacter sp.]|uniref:hypothetical protein n=1 Tax=Patulibacter sp. TaxID=1912859 RepID=UPI002728155D|nr:hypothetical protein [Patulibacter sp.]MDO9408413.1 hypothetical protein [Patulibacter sp.]